MKSMENFGNKEEILKKIDTAEAKILSEENSNSSSTPDTDKKTNEMDTIDLYSKHSELIKDGKTFELENKDKDNDLDLKGEAEEKFFQTETTKEKNEIFKIIEDDFSKLEKEILLLNIRKIKDKRTNKENVIIKPEELKKLKEKIQDFEKDWKEIIEYNYKLAKTQKTLLSYLVSEKVESFKNKINELSENKNTEDRIADVDEKAKNYLKYEKHRKKIDERKKVSLPEVIINEDNSQKLSSEENKTGIKSKIRNFFEKRNDEKSIKTLKQIAEKYDPEKIDSAQEIEKAMNIMFKLSGGTIEEIDNLIKKIKTELRNENGLKFYEEIKKQTDDLKELLKNENEEAKPNEEITVNNIVMDS